MSSTILHNKAVTTLEVPDKCFKNHLLLDFYTGELKLLIYAKMIIW